MKFTDLDTKLEMNANDAYGATNENTYATICTPELESPHTYERVTVHETMLVTYKNQAYDSGCKHQERMRKLQLLG